MTQDDAFDILTSGASVFLTGEPGSGKTHIVNRYVAYLREHGVEPAITASTGIAATHVNGMTIHSWSGIGIKDALSSRDLDLMSQNERLHKRMAKAHVLIIDEISMLDARVLDMVDAACRAVRRNTDAFGGLQVVLVGDFFQLPPVSRNRKAVFAFRSAAWRRLDPVVCYLTEQHRQDDDAFLGVLSAIRTDAVEAMHLDLLDSRAEAAHKFPKDTAKLFAHNKDVDRINDDELRRLPGKERTCTMLAHGHERLVESLRRSCLSPERLVLKPDATVMFTRNDPQGRFVNGTLGSVTGFDDEGLPIVRTKAGRRVVAEPMSWSIEDQGKTLASVVQVPLRLAWAMTIHKSQGMTIDAALVDLRAAFEFGQGYVALSRVRSLKSLFLLGRNDQAIRVHPDVLCQDGLFRDASDGAAQGLALVSADARRKTADAFVVRCGGRIGASPATEKSYDVGEVRKRHASAYARWTEKDEKTLAKLFRKGTPVKEIAAHLGRKPGGITSRLKKLGLER